MAVYTAGDVITILGQQLHDVGQDIWTEALLLTYMSEAQNHIALLRPDSTAVVEPFTLAESAKQTIPAGGVQFLNCIRNLGAGGTTPGRHIKRITRDEIDGYYPEWTSTESATAINRFIYEAESPKVFWVYPTPSVATLSVELAYSKSPTKLTDTEDDIGVDDTYVTALIEWVMYRCMSMEGAGASVEKAARHHASFYGALQGKLQTDQVLKTEMR